jgi:hypothetical protein
MASYNLKFNSDDSVVRHLIVGLLADLNNKLYFYRQIDNNTRIAVDIPFYYSITGDDQFLRDNFLFTTASGPDCHPDEAFADGNYDVVPRGVVNLTSLSIDSGSLVNKRNMGEYTKMNTSGAMEGYTSEFEAVPVTLGVDVEILVSSTLDTLKVIEAMIKTLYKSNQYSVEVGHLNEGTYRLPAYYAMPDDYEVQRPIDFTFEDKDKYKTTLSLEIKSFLPAFEWDTERHIGNRMFEINSSTITAADIDSEIVNINRALDTITVSDDGVQSTNPNTRYVPSTSFNSADIQFPQQPAITRDSIILDANDYSAPVSIAAGSIGKESIIIATNGTVDIDVSNFAAVTALTLNDGGTATIKYINNAWYVTGTTNSIIAY